MMKSFVLMLYLTTATGLFVAVSNVGLAQTAPANSTEAILQYPGFRERLVWIGTNEPEESENIRLLAIITNLSSPSWTLEVEKFLQDNPKSPWSASLHHVYASFCRGSGRTTKALEHWEAAWQLVENDTSPAGRQLGSAILVNWLEQLSSLGRVEKLRELVPSGDRWPFAEPRQRERFLSSKNAFYVMQSHPEISFRCGTFALRAVGLFLQPTNHSLNELVGVPSPTNGFTVAALATLSEQYGLKLTAVRRTQGKELVVPSIIHWRQNHYAAILDAKEGAYLIDDPTFGRPKWMSLEAINEEASGVFFIPVAVMKPGWTALDQTEMAAVHGMGLPSQVSDGLDKGCLRDFSGQTVCVPCNPKGMPVAWVSEPYINLWIADEPVSYMTSSGETFDFRLTYKQRDTRPDRSSGTLVAVTGWNHSWFSFIHVGGGYCFGPGTCSGPIGPNYATLYLPNGGEVSFAANGPEMACDPESHLTIMKTSTTISAGGEKGANGLRVIHPDGTQDIYDFVITYPVSANQEVTTDYVWTRHIDPHGRSTSFIYEFPISLGQYRLKYVVDPDGRTNTLKYWDGSGVCRLTNVASPYGQSAQFQYDASLNLTNITDAAGLSSGISYDTNSYPTSLVTPYGTNKFLLYDLVADDHISGQGNFGGHNLIDRAVQITDAAGSKKLFLYRYDCSSFMSTNYSSSDVPDNTPLGTLDTGLGGGTNILAAVSFRNSFAWDARQYAGILANNTNLSTTSIRSLTNLTANDYLRGRMRHWLQDTNLIQFFVAGQVSVERAPSPDGTAEGLKVFYDYAGKTYNFVSGTDPLPAVMAWRLPGAETHYEYVRFDVSGNLTNRVATYTKSDGSLGTRTNQFVYAANTYTNVLQVYQDGILSDSKTNTFTATNLLTQVIGPDGTNVMTAGGFEAVIWTNDFGINSFTTNRVLLSSLRVIPSLITNAMNEVTTLTFTNFNQVSSVKYSSGLTTTNIYSTNGLLTRTIDVETGRTNSFGYATNNLISTLTNESGLVIGLFWNNLLRLTGASFPDSTIVSNVYTALDLTAQKDRLGHWTYLGYDRLQHPNAITNALTNVTSLDWCGCGALSTITDALTNTATFLYDNQGRLTNVAYPDSSSRSYEYDAAGRTTNVFDGLGRYVRLSYNNQGLVSAVSNASGQVFKAVYDILDRPVVVTDANSITITNGFDALGRIVTRLWPDGIGEGYSYSTTGLAAYTNRNQKVTHYGRDVAGRLAAVTNANQEVTQFGYDAAGRINSLIDGLTHSTTWHYNQFGWLTNKVDAFSNEVLRLSYDAGGEVTNRWLPASGNTVYAYDAIGNATNISFSGSASNTVPISLAYDKVGRLTNMIDAAGTTGFSYTPTGQLKSEDGPWSNDTLVYDYLQGHRTAFTINSSSPSSINYSYDSLWRLTNLVSAAGSFGYSYHSAVSPLVQSIALPNLAGISNHFDSLGRLDSTALVNYWGHTLDGAAYEYGIPDLRTKITRDLGLTTNTVDLAYDDIGQLTKWTGKEPDGAARLNEKLGYGYDAAGNLQSRTNNALVQTFSVNNLNELSTITRSGTLTVSGATPAPATNITVNGNTATLYTDLTFASTNFGLTNGNNAFSIIASNVYGVGTTNAFTLNLPSTINLQYDTNGNLTGDGLRTFVYDAENQLTNVYVTNSWRTDFVYDGMGRKRIARDYTWQGTNWLKTTETRYVYDGLLAVQERDSNNAVLVTYTRGLDLSGSLQGAGGIGGLLARTDSSNASAFFHSDGSGNVTALIDSQQNVVARYLYDPYGRLLASSGNLADANRYRFSSKEIHPASGLYYYGFRFYDPSLQRWLNQDPIGENGGINLYGFVGNSPQGRVDPLGMDSWTDYLLAIISPIHQTEMLAKTISEPVMNMAYGAKGALEQQKLDEFVRQNTDFADYGEFMDELHRRQGMDVVDMSGSSSSQLYIRRTANGTSGAASLYVTVVTSRVPASKICSTGIKAVENGVPKGGLPELRISAGKYPELAENILHAQRAGHPEVLTHGGEAVIDANRNAALHQPYRDFVPNIGNGLTRDEYPFASSMEGGAGAWVGHIPKDQQNAQGGLIRAMNLKPGDQYRVVIVP